MPLFIPTSGAAPIPFAGWPTKKGQLYNMDNNEKLSFQFNVETFEWEQKFNWAEITWKGSVSGGDLDFINSGPRTFDLPLLFLGDPGAPEIEYEIGDDNPVVRQVPGNIKMDFEFIQKLIERWTWVMPHKGRPPRIKVVIGTRWFEGVIEELNFKLIDFFPDLTVKEALMTISFREWNLYHVIHV